MPSWNVCACGAGVDGLEQRMKAFALAGVEAEYSGARIMEDKEQAERGRTRDRSRSRTREAAHRP